jgi:WD40 repeat protein
MYRRAIGMIVLLAVCTMVASGAAQTPSGTQPPQGTAAPDSVVPLVAGITVLQNASLTLDSGKNVTVNIPYYIDGTTIIPLPVWVIVGEPEVFLEGKWQTRPPVWAPSADDSKNPLKVRFRLRNLLADEKTRKIVYNRLRQEVSENLGLNQTQIRFVQPNLSEDSFAVSLLRLRDNGPLTLVAGPQQISQVCLQESDGGWVEMTLPPQNLTPAPQLQQLCIQVHGPMRAQLRQEQISATVSLLRQSYHQLLNDIKPKYHSAQPEYLLFFPTKEGTAEQQTNFDRFLLQYLSIELSVRRDLPAKDRTFPESMLRELVRMTIKEVELQQIQDQQTVTILLGQQAHITATLGEIRQLAAKKRAEREQFLKDALDRHYEEHHKGINMKAISISRLISAGFTFSDNYQQHDYKHNLEYLQKALDDLQQHFEGNVKTLSGVALNQKSLSQSFEQLEGRYKQYQFVTDWYRYDWPPLSLTMSADIPGWMQKMEEQYRQVTDAEQKLQESLKAAHKQLQELRVAMQGNAKDYQTFRDLLTRCQQELADLQKQTAQLPQDKLQERITQLSQRLEMLEMFLSGQTQRVLKEHKGRVYSVAASQDGRVVVSGGSDGVVCVWDGRSGQLRRRLEGHKGGVNGVAVSGDGGVVVSGSADGTVRVWDGVNGRLLHSLKGPTDVVRSVSVSADGRVVVSGGDDGVVCVWDGGSGALRHRLEGHKGEVLGVAVSGDGGVVVSGGDDGVVCVWDGRSGALRHRLEGHKGEVLGVAVSGDGGVVVSGGGDGVVCVWDGVNGRLVHSLKGHTDVVRGVAVSADGRLVLSGSDDKTVRVWDVANGKLLHTLEGNTDWVRGVSVSADGRVVVSGSDDETVRVYYFLPPKSAQANPR